MCILRVILDGWSPSDDGQVLGPHDQYSVWFPHLTRPRPTQVLTPFRLWVGQRGSIREGVSTLRHSLPFSRTGLVGLGQELFRRVGLGWKMVGKSGGRARPGWAGVRVRASRGDKCQNDDPFRPKCQSRANPAPNRINYGKEGPTKTVDDGMHYAWSIITPSTIFTIILSHDSQNYQRHFNFNRKFNAKHGATEFLWIEFQLRVANFLRKHALNDFCAGVCARK